MGKQNMEEKSVLSVFTGKKQTNKQKKNVYLSVEGNSGLKM